MNQSRSTQFMQWTFHTPVAARSVYYYLLSSSILKLTRWRGTPSFPVNVLLEMFMVLSCCFLRNETQLRGRSMPGVVADSGRRRPWIAFHGIVAQGLVCMWTIAYMAVRRWSGQGLLIQRLDLFVPSVLTEIQLVGQNLVISRHMKLISARLQCLVRLQSCL